MTDAMPVGERRQLAPPVDETGALGWARKNLFSSWVNGLATVVLVAGHRLAAVVVPRTGRCSPPPSPPRPAPNAAAAAPAGR